LQLLPPLPLLLLPLPLLLLSLLLLRLALLRPLPLKQVNKGLSKALRNNKRLKLLHNKG
jgi:hypothetical protein